MSPSCSPPRPAPAETRSRTPETGKDTLLYQRTGHPSSRCSGSDSLIEEFGGISLDSALDAQESPADAERPPDGKPVSFRLEERRIRLPELPEFPVWLIDEPLFTRMDGFPETDPDQKDPDQEYPDQEETGRDGGDEALCADTGPVDAMLALCRPPPLPQDTEDEARTEREETADGTPVYGTDTDHGWTGLGISARAALHVTGQDSEWSRMADRRAWGRRKMIREEIRRDGYELMRLRYPPKDILYAEIDICLNDRESRLTDRPEDEPKKEALRRWRGKALKSAAALAEAHEKGPWEVIVTWERLRRERSHVTEFMWVHAAAWNRVLRENSCPWTPYEKESFLHMARIEGSEALDSAIAFIDAVDAIRDKETFFSMQAVFRNRIGYRIRTPGAWAEFSRDRREFLRGKTVPRPGGRSPAGPASRPENVQADAPHTADSA